MSSNDLLVAGVDVGGTNIEVGLVDDAHEVHARAKAATPEGGPQAVLSTIIDLINSLGGDPIAVGVGIPGVVHEGQVLTVPNLVGWNERVDLVADLSSPVALGNDANVGLLGEWLAGAALGARNVLGVWMGTGITSQRQLRHHRWWVSRPKARVDDPCRKYRAQPRVICPRRWNITRGSKPMLLRPVASDTFRRIVVSDVFDG